METVELIIQTNTSFNGTQRWWSAFMEKNVHLQSHNVKNNSQKM